MLPVRHNVTKREVMDYSPSLADRVARSTATHTVEEIAAEIVDVIRNPRESWKRNRRSWRPSKWGWASR